MTISLTEPRDELLAGAIEEEPRRLTDIVFRTRELGIVAALFIFVGVTTLIQHRMVEGQNIKFILTNTTVFALLAVGEAVVVFSRNVDLSVGSVLGISGYLSTDLFVHYHHLPIPVVFLVGLAVGAVCGAVNGAIVSVFRVPSLVITLATLYIIRGIDTLVVGGNQIVAYQLPSSFIAIGQSTFPHTPIPDVAVAVVVVVGVVAYYLRNFRPGRELYAIGSNPDAATLAGIPAGKRIFTAFVFSGAIAGLAGVVWVAQQESANSVSGNGYELQVIAAVVVGGVAIFGGFGSVIGAAVGALLLQTINSALEVLRISTSWEGAIAGFLLLCAISLDRGITLRLTSALKKRSARVT